MPEPMSLEQKNALLAAYNSPPPRIPGPNPLIEAEQRRRVQEMAIADGQRRIMDWVRDNA